METQMLANMLSHGQTTLVENLGLHTSPFGQALSLLALTCNELRSLWWKATLHASRRQFSTQVSAS